ESAVLRPRAAANTDLIRRDLIEMSEAISRTRQEIAAIKSPDEQDNSQLITATEELDAIVASTEKATSDILQAAEDIQETAWLLRESGTEDEACNRLDERATDIYTACSFQDLTGQRTDKVVNALHFLESRVNSMIDIWGLNEVVPQRNAPGDGRPDAHLLNGPQIDGRGMDQDDIDVMIGRPDLDIEVVEASVEPAEMEPAARPELPAPEPARIGTAAEPELPAASPDIAAQAIGEFDPGVEHASVETEAPLTPGEAECLETPSLDVHPPAALDETESVPGPAIAASETETAAAASASIMELEPAMDLAEPADEPEDAGPQASSLDLDQSDASAEPVAAHEPAMDVAELADEAEDADPQASSFDLNQSDASPEPADVTAPAAVSEPEAVGTADAGSIVQASEPVEVSDLTIGDLNQEQRTALFS
ncbi:MAG: hypothetical protein ACR2PO_17290, partial [Methyloligellaceae bacterium]